MQIAKLLRSVASALSLSKGAVNNFRMVAYQKAADAIEHSSSEVKDLWDDGKLGTLSGVGESIAASLDELFKTGRVKHFDSILKEFPPALFELLEVPGIGPKRAYKLTKELGITKAHSAISQLEKAASKGRVRELEGLGEESEADIIQGIKEYKGRSKRMLIDVAQTTADSIMEWMRKSPYVKRIDPLGSLRRQATTVGDVDLSVASDHPKEVMEHFKKYPYKSRVLEAGEQSASLILPNEYQVDLMVQPPAAYGALLQHFTGSKHHNIALRELALKRGFSLSEKGIKVNDKVKQFATEEEFYKFLGLDWIPPELREGGNEIDLAKNHQLPKLIEVSDIKGDLQMHSNLDVETSHDNGVNSLAEMAAVAAKLGYEYIGVTEHNPAFSRHTSQQIIDLIERKSESVHKYNSSEKRVHIFNGLEIDIQLNGNRALPDQALELLDYACVSIHSSFRGTRQQMTYRVLKALDHPKVRFFAHPTGRLLGEREGVELDWEQIFDYCKNHHKWLEIDGWPNRLDLPDSVARDAIKQGVKLVVDTDAHAAEHLKYMRYGVAVARRAGATESDVVNTSNLNQMKSLIEKVSL